MAPQLDFTTGMELFNNFEKILVDTAEEKWENLVSGISNPGRPDTCFGVEMDNIYCTYCNLEER
eukprot:11617192-Ditylum_brightwellii.AAC.1